jgi:hypothetical protein
MTRYLINVSFDDAEFEVEADSEEEAREKASSAH